MVKEKNVRQFDRDVSESGGYVYTTNQKLSSLWANRRQSEAIRQIVSLTGKKVLDVGCGDGTYTLEFLEQKPMSILGVDASQEAVRAAQRKSEGFASIRYQALDIQELETLRETFDVAVVRGVLHHLYDAPRAIETLSKITRVLIVIEPNGYNPILKLIERFSKYHIEHEEKSYFPFALRAWFRKYGGRVEDYFYCGLVPFFCPDGLARFLKGIEPMVEKTPLLKQLGCAIGVYRVAFGKDSA